MMRFFIAKHDKECDAVKIDVIDETTKVHIETLSFMRTEAIRLGTTIQQCCLKITEKEMQRRGR